MTTLVDTNVLLDLVTDDPAWADWSVSQLELAALHGPLVINDVIYAELAVRYGQRADLDVFLDEAGIDLMPIPREALFLAGKAFLTYRKSAGTKTGVLPDFFIGAHAQVDSLLLLTRDRGRYGTYFPAVQLVTPAA